MQQSSLVALLVVVPRELRTRLKVAAAMAGTTNGKLVVEAIEGLLQARAAGGNDEKA